MWSDPSSLNGWIPSSRGVSYTFGQDESEQFLYTNNLKLIIRGHELAMEVGVVTSLENKGFEKVHNGKVITVFSAPNYCYCTENKGAFIEVDEYSQIALFGCVVNLISSYQFECAPTSFLPVCLKYLSRFFLIIGREFYNF